MYFFFRNRDEFPSFIHHSAYILNDYKQYTFRKILAVPTMVRTTNKFKKIKMRTQNWFNNNNEQTIKNILSFEILAHFSTSELLGKFFDFGNWIFQSEENVSFKISLKINQVVNKSVNEFCENTLEAHHLKKHSYKSMYFTYLHLYVCLEMRSLYNMKISQSGFYDSWRSLGMFCHFCCCVN